MNARLLAQQISMRDFFLSLLLFTHDVRVIHKRTPKRRHRRKFFEYGKLIKWHIFQHDVLRLARRLNGRPVRVLDNPAVVRFRLRCIACTRFVLRGDCIAQHAAIRIAIAIQCRQ